MKKRLFWAIQLLLCCNFLLLLPSFAEDVSNAAQLSNAINNANISGSTPSNPYIINIIQDIIVPPIPFSTVSSNVNILGNNSSISFTSIIGTSRFFFDGTADGLVSTISDLLITRTIPNGSPIVYNDQMTLSLNNVTLHQIIDNSDAGAFHNKIGTATISNSTFSQNTTTATFDGGGLYNEQGTVILKQGNIFTKNKAGGASGAIHNFGGTVITTGSIFNKNEADDRAGAIFNSNGTIILNAGNVFSENICNGTFGSDPNRGDGGAILNNQGTLIINAGNTFTGNIAQSDGGAIYNRALASISGSSFNNNLAESGSGGAIYNSTGGTLDITGSAFINNNAAISGGALANEAGTVNLTSGTNKNITFTGNLSNGIPNDIDISDISGVVNINGNSGIMYADGGFSGVGTINKTGNGSLVIAERAVNENFSGIYNQAGGTLTNYSTSFFGGTNSISNSNFNLFQSANMTINNLSLNNVYTNSINRLITTTVVNNFSASGINNFALDINANAKTADKFILNGNASGNFNITNILISGVPTEKVIPFRIFEISGMQPTYSQTVSQPITTPIYKYGFRSDGNGQYSLYREGHNPQVFRGQVATLAQYQNQLGVNNVLFDHVYLDSNELTAKNSTKNQYASLYPQFAPYQFVSEGGGLWLKSYAAFERLSMTQGLNINNNTYGALLGGDFDTIHLQNSWEFLPTVYIGYNGGHQTFNGVSMYQNGGQGGFMGTFSKGDYIGSILAYGGGYNNDMSGTGFSDDTGNWFAGTAIKQAYNFKPTRNFIIQPNVLVSYNIFGEQNWGTDFGALSMNSGLLNGINVAPGLNLIYGRETWSVYLTTLYMYNINDNVNGSAGSIGLPSVSMRHGYFEYGIGALKEWKERFLSYMQIDFRNGGRTGIGFQLGVSLKF